MYFAKAGSKYYLLTEHNDTWITVTSQIANLIVYPNWLIYWPWFGVLITLLVSYWILNRQLTPISRAIKSATEISLGNLQYRIEKTP